MAFIVPNAGDTTGGNKFEALDQAEPDSIDFEVIGLRTSGVVSGCEVTSNSSSSTVAVAAGTVVLAGVPYTTVANAALALPAFPADNRFDLVVARVSGGTATLTVLSGENSSTNPEFSKSSTVLTGAPGVNNFNPSTDVLLAALYRAGSSTVTASRIVDKRAIVGSSIVHQGTSDPLTAFGNGVGQLYYNTTAPDGPQSGVWVKRPNGTWIELAQNVGSHLPIGAMVMWPSDAAMPTGCVEASGQSLATDAYPALFTVYGYKHGGAGGSFNVINMNDYFPRGTTTPALVGTTSGSNSLTLTTAQLPSHSHTISHTHTYSHTHGINHDHPSATTSDNGNHDHTGNISNNGVAQAYGDLYSGDVIVARWYTVGPTGSGGSHTHTFNVPSYTGSTTSQSTTTTSAASTSSSGNAGSGSSISIIPKSMYTRFIIRASLGADTASAGDPSPYEHIFSQAVELENPAVGETYLWVAAFDCQISRVRAYRLDGTGMTVNVKVADTDYALGVDLTTPTPDSWVSATSAQEVNEGDLVEVEVIAVTGSPTLGIVQVDFES